MRVAIFTDHDHDSSHPVTTALNAVRRWAPFGCQTRIYAAADRPRLWACGQELRREGVDLVHITTPGPVGLAGRWMAARMGVPVVGSYHARPGDHVEAVSGSARLGRLIDDYAHWLYASSRVLLVPSQAARTALERQGYRPDQLRVWPRGVDTRQYTPARASGRLRSRWGVDDRRFAILCAGRLSADRGLPLIPRIQRELHRRGIAHRFIFAGEGPMVPQLQRDCPDGIFLGTLSTDQMAVTMASADILLFPSALEICGQVVLDAQASGLPVIVTDEGGPREQVIHEATGMVCRSRSTRDLVEALVRLRHPAARRSMSLCARQFAVAQDWSLAVQPLFATWTRVIGSPAGTARPFASMRAARLSESAPPHAAGFESATPVAGQHGDVTLH
jgi:glycosyltransferase involved in cell wall biosynthesis